MSFWKFANRSSDRNGNSAQTLPPAAITVLSALQTVVTRTAVGAARTAARLSKLTSQTSDLSQHLQEISRLTAELKAGIDGMSRVSASTAQAATEMKSLIQENQVRSDEASRSAVDLKEHMTSSFDRINSLVTKVQSISEISNVVKSIAMETKMLSFNAAIEAARAGESGKGFTVVAEQIRNLATTTATQTQEIFSVLSSLMGDIDPSRQAIEQSRDLASDMVEKNKELHDKFERINSLVASTSENMTRLAASVERQKESVEVVFERLGGSTAACSVVEKEASAINADTNRLSTGVEEAYEHLAEYDTGSIFHRSLAHSREAAERIGSVFESAIDAGRFSLADALELRYKEIRGGDIAGLSRLFDVSRVPSTGFEPPKHSTCYDSSVDEAVLEIIDEIKARESQLAFAILIDLNTYAPIHNSDFCKDWTGVRDKDLGGNRIKRFFNDNRSLLRAARVGLSRSAVDLPGLPSRADFKRLSPGEMAESPETASNYLVQTYTRDTGAVMTLLSVPFFLRGERFGAIALGWNDDT